MPSVTISSKPRIAIFLPSLEQGGAERRMCLLAVALKDKGYFVEVVVLREKGMFIEVLTQSNIPIKSIEKGGRWDMLGAFLRTFKLFSENRYSTVLSCLPSANLFSVVSKLASRQTQLIWGIAVADLPVSQYGLWAKLGYTLQKQLSVFTDHIVVNSELGRQSAIRQGFNENKLSLIRNGIDIEQFYFDHNKLTQYKKEWRLQYGIPESAYLIGLIGRLDPAKGIETFLEAATRKVNKNVYFVIIGSGTDDYANALRAKVKSHSLFNTKLFLVEDERVSLQTYHAIDLPTIASVSEGLPNVLLEALACGKRVVSTDVGDCRFVLGNHGQIIPSSDVDAMLEAWKVELNTEYSHEMTEQYLQTNFTITTMAEGFENLLTSTCLEDKMKGET